MGRTLPGERSRAGTVLRRIGRIVAGLLAVGLTTALIGFLGFAVTNYEELKTDLPRLDGTRNESTLDSAANAAIGFGRDAARPPAATGRGRGYAFSSPAPKGTGLPPAHWCSATVIGYRIDFAGAELAGLTPADERHRWRAAARQWRVASGGAYRFEYRGPGSYPVNDDDPTGAPIDPASIPVGEIAISYARAPESAPDRWARYLHPAMTGTLGMAGVDAVGWDGPQAGVLQRGMVVIDAVDAAADPKALPTPYVHEFGHALGLDHVEDTGQVMATHAGSTSVINDGDRTGIRTLAAVPCG